MAATWRETAARIVEAVLCRTHGQPEAVIKKALFDAYPYGERRYHPYKVWLSEIRRQRGIKPKAKPIIYNHVFTRRNGVSQ